MFTKQNNTGFTIIEIVIIAAIVAVIGIVGYSVYNRQTNQPTNDSTNPITQSQNATTIPAAPTVRSTSDLNNAETLLDQAGTSLDNSDSADTNQLDGQLDNF